MRSPRGPGRRLAAPAGLSPRRVPRRELLRAPGRASRLSSGQNAEGFPICCPLLGRPYEASLTCEDPQSDDPRYATYSRPLFDGEFVAAQESGSGTLPPLRVRQVPGISLPP